MASPEDDEGVTVPSDQAALIKTDDEAKQLAPELVRLALREGMTINVNVLIERVTQKVEDPKEAMALYREALGLAREWEGHALDTLKKRADVVIDFEERNPKEIEARKESAVRRLLKMTTAACALVGLGGGVICVVQNAPLPVTLTVLAIGVVGAVMLGPLATDQAISVTDVVQAAKATLNLGHKKGDRGDEHRGKGKRRKG